jgi:hypothetical protein
MSPARSIAPGERLEPRHVLSGFGVIEPLAASPAGDAADPVPIVFTTSNQVPAGGTILASPVEPTNIGRAQSFLEAVPGVARISVPASKGGIDFTLDVLDVPRETSLYKALKIPASGLFQQDDVLNRFAVSTNWYSSLDVASNYADSDWGRSQGYQVVEFAAPKALRLIDLGDDDTLGYVWASLESDVAWTESQLASLQGADPPTTNPQAVEIVTQKLAELRRDMEIVQLTTGFNASYATQLDLLLTYGDAITNDFTYHPGTEIARRGSSPSDTFIVETATTGVWRPATLVTGTTSDPVDLVTWGGTIEDLNRISFTTDIDKELTSILGTYLNVDGYFATELPSLFHRHGRLIEEIGLFLPRDSTAIVPQPTIDPRPDANFGVPNTTTVSRPPLRRSATLRIQAGIMGPQPVQFSWADLAGAVLSQPTTERFVVVQATIGVVEKWDGRQWVDVTRTPTGGSPQEWLRLLSLRVIRPTDQIRWVPPASLAPGQTAFQILGWDGGSVSDGLADISFDSAAG